MSLDLNNKLMITLDLCLRLLALQSSQIWSIFELLSSYLPPRRTRRVC